MGHGRRGVPEDSAAFVGARVISVGVCVEIKFRAPHAIDAMLSP